MNEYIENKSEIKYKKLEANVFKKRYFKSHIKKSYKLLKNCLTNNQTCFLTSKK